MQATMLLLQDSFVLTPAILLSVQPPHHLLLPFQPHLPHIHPFFAVQLLDYHTPNCKRLAATSHMVREKERDTGSV